MAYGPTVQISLAGLSNDEFIYNLHRLRRYQLETIKAIHPDAVVDGFIEWSGKSSRDAKSRNHDRLWNQHRSELAIHGFTKKKNRKNPLDEPLEEQEKNPDGNSYRG